MVMAVKKIREMEPFNRPREKLVERGVSALKDEELLAVILGRGNRDNDVRTISVAIHREIEEKKENLKMDDLLGIPGVGPAKAGQVLAALEYSRRGLVTDRPKITGPGTVLALVGEIRARRQEHFLVLSLDGANRLIEKRVVFIGTLNASLVHPREVFALAITDRAAAIILVHNHPSGQLEPSREDLAITERLCQAGELLGIEVLDHLIVTAESHVSFNERGLLR